jgi:hypothetical protein
MNACGHDTSELEAAIAAANQACGELENARNEAVTRLFHRYERNTSKLNLFLELCSIMNFSNHFEDVLEDSKIRSISLSLSVRSKSLCQVRNEECTRPQSARCLEWPD